MKAKERKDALRRRDIENADANPASPPRAAHIDRTRVVRRNDDRLQGGREGDEEEKEEKEKEEEPGQKRARPKSAGSKMENKPCAR